MKVRFLECIHSAKTNDKFLAFHTFEVKPLIHRWIG
jgi:hypothetical protein